MKKFARFNIQAATQAFEGDRIKIDRVFNKLIVVEAFEIRDSKFKDKGNGKYLLMQVYVDNTKRVVWTGSIHLMEIIQKIEKKDFPFETTIIKNNNDRYEFT